MNERIVFETILFMNMMRSIHGYWQIELKKHI